MKPDTILLEVATYLYVGDELFLGMNIPRTHKTLLLCAEYLGFSKGDVPSIRTLRNYFNRQHPDINGIWRHGRKAFMNMLAPYALEKGGRDAESLLL